MYVFAEPVTEEQVVEIQSQNDEKIHEIESNILGLIRGNDSETDDAQDDDSKWETIQADVEKAMETDELLDDGSDQDQKIIDEGAEGSQPKSDRPEVFEHGPLYASRSASGLDDDLIAVPAGHQEEEGDDGEDDDIDGKAESEHSEEKEEEEESEEDGDESGNGEVEGNRRQERPEESFEGEADIGTDENNVALSVDHSIRDQNTTIVIGGKPNDTREETDEEYIGIPSAAEPNTITERESQQEDQTKADRPSINEEIIQADTTAESSKSEGILAMTLTLRNKVNGKYVLRPLKMTATDEWTVEYSLTEVSDQTRARALYNACQLRRKKKMERALVPDEDEGGVNGYIQNLRNLSTSGRKWRKKQDKMDSERPVQVLSTKVVEA